jgi:hypothetical protein
VQLEVDEGRFDDDLLAALLELDLGRHPQAVGDRRVGEQVEALELEGQLLREPEGPLPSEVRLHVAAEDGA